MSDGGSPSHTARRVAWYRLHFERVSPPAPTGMPDAEDRLAADVAGDLAVDHKSPMARHLRARTAFFDHVTVGALERHVAQIVVVGAGYDGRSFRFAAPGVRWWEVDRAITQADKRSRLARLGITTAHVVYVGLDLAEGALAAALLAAGFRRDAPALFLAEGVAPYLGAGTLQDVLKDLRSVATLSSRLAISLRGSGVDPARRARFETSVAAFGEPALGGFTADDAPALFAESQWRMVNQGDRSALAGFLLAAPTATSPSALATAVPRLPREPGAVRADGGGHE